MCINVPARIRAGGPQQWGSLPRFYGGTVLPLRNRKGGDGNPPPTDARASGLPDNVHGIGRGRRFLPGAASLMRSNRTREWVRLLVCRFRDIGERKKSATEAQAWNMRVQTVRQGSSGWSRSPRRIHDVRASYFARHTPLQDTPRSAPRQRLAHARQQRSW